MKKFLLFILMVMLSLPVFAADNPQIKGDFKTLYLGDTKEIINDKVWNLVDQDETIVGISDEPIRFFDAVIFGQNMHIDLEFYKDQLYQITITGQEYLASDISKSLKDFISAVIKPAFITLYSKPTKDYDYPTISKLQEGYVTYIAKWELQKKTIYLGIVQTNYQFYPYMLIESKNLAVDKKIDAEVNLQKNIASSMSDFN